MVEETLDAPAPKKTEAKKESPKKDTPKAEKNDTPKAEKKEATKAKSDDLKKIEGIGPKIAEIFNNAGIVSFSDLASSEVSKLENILAEAGNRYKSHNPSTWPQQAELAAAGKWDELEKLQDDLQGGVVAEEE
nr:helix-hairpin-helix domain-containing protein [Portibacter marinus]